MFDHALLESQPERKGRSKGIGLPLAIGLHAAVLGAFIGASVWYTEEPVEPVIPVTFFATHAGPPPPIGTGGSVRPHASPPRLHQSAAFSSVMPALPQTTDEPGQPPGPEYPGPETGPPGDSRGAETGTGTHPAGPEVVATDDPLPVGGDVRAPVLLERIEPAYSDAALRAHLQGVVILEAIITASGDVEEIRVMRSANPLLDDAALRAVRKWRYKPATLNGRAVRVFLTVSVTFGIRS